MDILEIFMDIHTLRASVINDEIDSITLKHLLKDYKKPRDKISSLLKSGDLIQVKRGLYVFGEKFRKQPYNLLSISNLLYGPSAVSFEFALSYYGMIPERVEAVTAITPKRNKIYNTPLGRFTYKYIHPNKFSVGITLIKVDDTHNVMIASPEKALCDVITFSKRKIYFNTLIEVEEYLIEDIRIDEDSISKLDSKKLLQINEIYRHPAIKQLILYLSYRRDDDG